MNFWDAGGMVVKHGSSATRLAWQGTGQFIYLDDKNPERVRVKIDRSHLGQERQRAMNFYPTQEDMLATDWELCR